MSARATIVLVTWNARANVSDLLSSIRTFTRNPCPILAVDNASRDGTHELLAETKGLSLIANPENRRCAAATNQALARVETEYVVYLCASHALVTAPGWDET